MAVSVWNDWPSAAVRAAQAGDTGVRTHSTSQAEHPWYTTKGRSLLAPSLPSTGVEVGYLVWTTIDPPPIA